MTFGLVSASSCKNIEINFNTIKKYGTMAKENGCSALCFPECFLTGYFPKEADTLAIAIDSPFFCKLKMLASELQMDLLIGFMEKFQDKYYITHVLFLPDGTYHGYRKTHLGSREQEVFASGDSLEVFRLSCGIQAGFQLCVETHFNDITQTLSLRGAQIIFAPHAVPKVSGDRKQIWEKYIPARSYDNKVFFACCNQWDEERFGGGILVTAPTGDILASCYHDHENLLTFSIDETSLSDPRMSKYYFPAKRRKDLYQ